MKLTEEEEKIASMAFFVSKKKIIIANKFKSVKIIKFQHTPALKVS